MTAFTVVVDATSCLTTDLTILTAPFDAIVDYEVGLQPPAYSWTDLTGVSQAYAGDCGGFFWTVEHD